LLRLIALHAPTRSRWSVARRLMMRANSERDASLFPIATALYEEAIRIAPDAPRIRMQYAHMLKEAGDFVAAEPLYLNVAAAFPNDPDIAIQLGHFYKMAGRVEEAEAAYQRATELRPGWAEAREELARVRSVSIADDAAGGGSASLLPELLPGGGAPAQARMREGFFLRRLAASMDRARGNYRRVLRGVEAIHGFVVSSARPIEITLSIDGAVVQRARLEPSTSLGDGQSKYPFNLWHDFSEDPRGQHQIELQAVGPRGMVHAHRELIDIVAPLSEADYPRSDAVAEPFKSSDRTLEEHINTAPSMVRPAPRGLLARSPRAILVQRVDQLGDMVCSVPALQRLRALFPEARLVVLATPANASLARTLSMIDDVVVVDFSEGPDGRRTMPFAEQKRLQQALEAYHFDIAIDLGETAGSRPLLLLSGAPFLYGFKDREFAWLSAGFEFNSRDPANRGATAAVAHKLVAMIDALGEVVARPPTIFRRDDLSPDMLTEFGLGSNGRYAVLHTGARLPYTRWPGFADLARLLLDRTDLKVVILADEPIEGIEHDRLITLTGRMDFDRFDALLQFCSLFVGSDSGPKHLASLRGAPVVSVHMARLNWNEWGQEASGLIVSRRVPCAGCGIGQDGDECGKQWACLRHIRAEEVFEAASRLL